MTIILVSYQVTLPLETRRYGIHSTLKFTTREKIRKLGLINYVEAKHSSHDTFELADNAITCVLRVDEIEKSFEQLDSESIGYCVLGTFSTRMVERSSELFIVVVSNDITRLPLKPACGGRSDKILFVDLTY
jgi:hypothetical protein